MNHTSSWSSHLNCVIVHFHNFDELLVYSKFVEEHVTLVKFVLQKLKKNKLYAYPGKKMNLQVQKWTFWDMCFPKNSGFKRKWNQLKNGKAQFW